MKFSNLLIQWYLQNKRDLPWRNTNPYNLARNHVTTNKVAQGALFFYLYKRFSYCFDLAKANEEQVLKLWQTRYYHARNLHKTAQYIAFG
jgi:A/G-specific adenine glycosylase